MGGQGGTVFPKVSTAMLTVPPKFKLRRDWAGSCLVRSHKEYIPSYNYFEAVIVTFQFPLYSMAICGVRRTQAPSLKHLKTLKSVILGNFHWIHTLYIHHVCIYDTCIQTHIHTCIIHKYTCIHVCMHSYIHTWIHTYKQAPSHLIIP